MRCGGCKKVVRKTKLVMTSDGAGGMKQRRLGACCSKNAVLLLAGSVEGVACKCGAPATTCTGCARDAAKTDARAPFAKAIEKMNGLMKAYGPASPKRDGLQLAINLLEGGDFS